MSSIITAAQRRRICWLALSFLASSVLTPLLSLGISGAQAQQVAEQLPAIEISSPGDQNRTRAKPSSDEGSGSRRAAPNVSQTSKPGGGPANSPAVTPLS